MQILNKKAWEVSKVKMIQMDVFQELEAHEKVMVIEITESMLLLYLEELSNLMVRTPDENVH